MPSAAASSGASASSGAAGPTGSIYDLGYRRYGGPRLGRRHAFRVLFAHSLRWTFGIGRGGRAKIWPFTMAGMILVPALVVVALQALARQFAGGVADQLPMGPSTLVRDSRFFLVLFVIGQAPDLLGRDLRHGTLTLYFSRSLGRTDYAVAKFLALTVGMALIMLVPQALMLLGRIFTSTDLGVGFGEALPLVLPVVASALGVGALLSAIGLAISSFTPRRAYASGAIAALLLVASSAIAVVVARGGNRGLLGWLALADPGTLADGFNAFVFGDHVPSGTEAGMLLERSRVPLPVFAGVTILVTVLAVGIMIARYRRVQA